MFTIEDGVEPFEKQAWVEEDMAENEQKLRSKVKFVNCILCSN